MRRHIIGIIAILLLATAATLWAWPLAGDVSFGLEAACWRVGALMSVVWLAYNDLRRLPVWLLVVSPVVIAVLMWKPRMVLIVVPILLAIAFLWPRKKKVS